MLKTLKEIAAADSSLAALLQRPYVDADAEMEFDDGASEQRQFCEAIKLIVSEALADDELDRGTIYARLREIADADDASTALLESIREEVGLLKSELAEVRRREASRRALEAAGLDAAALDAERLDLLFAQPDEEAARALIESWPPYIGHSQRRASPSQPEKYPETVDDFVAAVR